MTIDQLKVAATAAQLIAERKADAKLALQSLILQCQREIRNLDRFEDRRMLIATADLRRFYEFALNCADEFEDAYLAAQVVAEEDSDV